MQLIEVLKGMALQPPVLVSLKATLERVLTNRRNTPGACGFLNGFITLVRSQSGRGIPTAKATALIDRASRIKRVLGC